MIPSTEGVRRMLVLTRKLNEKVYIDGNIAICVVAIDRHTVRLGIEAPRDVSICREEILSRAVSDAPNTPMHLVER
jgi:carbon storage regulator CsrA